MSEGLIQGTDDWKKARCGSLGASQIHEALAKTKTGWGASRANVMAQLLVERLTKLPTEGYMNDAMRWGIETEAKARSAYQFMTGNEVVEIGLIYHPRIANTHASPDGLVGDNGLVELKCPNTATHLDTLLGAPIAGKYVLQCQWQMACSGRAWVDWVSYDPRMPVSMRFFMKRISRDNAEIARLEEHVSEFLGELDDRLSRLLARYDGASKAELKRALEDSVAAA